ncbi:hypothetical protein BG846_02361 [Streptomyces fradiae ATCC 10745 = DSM 40063]|uniref:Uncharacterized protein n=1 Tax=Streptomyces fradiae ATCC 10745 = DSM 40063 TaxID=1319510 RepID=A0A1Y2NY75_STRFR|nr:hypothetical protein BG846_02361 [Streptomyces fradiae ATCC 10745 = DSM 40063]
MPCASTRPIDSTGTPASASAAEITDCCAALLGTVNPLVRPPWFTAVPLMTPRTRSPSRRAARSGFSTTVTTPSPGTNPSAPESNGRRALDGENERRREPSWKYWGDMPRCTPATTACSHSPARMLRTAVCSATSDDEHSVSIVMLGPCRSRKKLTRFARIALWLPRPAGVWTTSPTTVSR